MLLPACRLHDGRDRHALGLAQQCDDGILLGVRSAGRNAAGPVAGTLLDRPLDARSLAIFLRVAGHPEILSVATASGAVTTEAPQWPHGRRGRIPGRPITPAKAPTVALCLRANASPFCDNLLAKFGVHRSWNDRQTPGKYDKKRYKRYRCSAPSAGHKVRVASILSRRSNSRCSRTRNPKYNTNDFLGDGQYTPAR